MTQELSIFSESDKRLREFATQLAMNVEKYDTVIKAFGLTPEEAKEIQEHPAFKAYHESALTEWTNANNSSGRAEVKAARAAEEAIPAIFRHIHDPDASDTSKIEAFKALGKMGRVGERAGAGVGGGGEMVKINITIGDTKLAFEKPMPIIEAVAEPA